MSLRLLYTSNFVSFPSKYYSVKTFQTLVHYVFVFSCPQCLYILSVICAHTGDAPFWYSKGSFIVECENFKTRKIIFIMKWLERRQYLNASPSSASVVIIFTISNHLLRIVFVSLSPSSFSGVTSLNELQFRVNVGIDTVLTCGRLTVKVTMTNWTLLTTSMLLELMNSATSFERSTFVTG